MKIDIENITNIYKMKNSNSFQDDNDSSFVSNYENEILINEDYDLNSTKKNI